MSPYRTPHHKEGSVLDRLRLFAPGVNISDLYASWEDAMRDVQEMISFLSLGALREANERRQAEWDADGQITAAFRGNELAGEVGEACNVIKKLERERLGIRGSYDTVDHLAEELADVIICVDLIAMDYGIDLSRAIARKFNATSEKVGLATRLDTGSAAD